jgi:hypothetical protein
VLAAEKVLRESKKQEFDEDGKIKVPAAGVTGDEHVPGKTAKTPKTMQEAGEELDKVAQGIKAEKKCSYKEAFDEARAKNPAIARIYDGKEG